MLFLLLAPDSHPSKLHEGLREDRCFRSNSEHMSEVVIEAGTIIKFMEEVLVFLAPRACLGESWNRKRYSYKQS